VVCVSYKCLHKHILTHDEAFSGRSSDSKPHNGRKHIIVNRESSSSSTNQPAPTAAQPHDYQNIGINPAVIMAPASISFEAQIGLALQGSNWQELQNSNSIGMPIQTETVVQESVFVDDEANLPPEMTTKQKKKKERFERTIARDTGDVLQLIEAESIMPVEHNVTWDQDPELVCSYNWQASTDDTNTIFGTLTCFRLFLWRSVSI
jgi:hypothetical protein